MASRSLRNHRGFFSEYWLGTVLAGSRGSGPRLSAAQCRKALDKVCRLVEAFSGTTPPDLTRFREKFARPLLEDIFGYTLHENPAEPRLRALSASMDDRTPAILAYLCPTQDELDSKAVRKRVDDALLANGLDHAFMLTPETLRLVRAPGIGARGAAFDLVLASVSDLADEESLAVAYRVLSAECFVRDADGRRPIDSLEEESRRHSARVSGELKEAVFDAAETIVGGFLADVRARPEAFGSAPTLSELRDAGFLALYRLLFILYAEARDPRLIDHRLYQRSYSVDHLLGKLAASPPSALAANRHELWMHLLAVFRIFNEGIGASLPDLENIPPRGGRLFSDETLEGELLKQVRLDDRSAAAVLVALGTTRPRRGVGRERVSFRELEIEQLGNVYEGLLEYEPGEALERMIEVSVGGRELALTPDEVVRLCDRKQLRVRGDPSIVEGTAADRLHPELALSDEPEDDAGTDDSDEEDGDAEKEEASIDRGAVLRLVRRIEPGEFFFKPGAARKASGSYYTPTPMVADLVRGALGPIAEGRPVEQIESLRIIDLACGSGHFLVGAARYLATHLYNAYRRECGADPPASFHPDRALNADTRARWESEGLDWCRRRIVERCLFGVDLNPAAVQLAQVALWIESLAGDRPLSFFAHHIRCGNSLLGSSLSRFDSPPDPKLGNPAAKYTRGLFEAEIRRKVDEAIAERRLIDAPLPPGVRRDSPDEYWYKEDRLERAEAAIDAARLLLDLRSASALVPEIWIDFPTLASEVDPMAIARTRPWWTRFEEVRCRERFFHWELEFPEVFLDGERPGFDAVLGNPPWDKVLPSKTEFYGQHDALIRAYKGGELDRRIQQLHREHPGLAAEFDAYRARATTIARQLRSGGDFPLAEARSQAAHEDVAKYFVDRALSFCSEDGAVGLVVPSVFYNGDGWVGIRRHLLDCTRIERFYGFENRRKLFPIDSRYKFVNLVARKASESGGAFTAAFMRHDVEELEQAGERPWEVRLRRDDIRRLSPETLAFLEFRGPRDQQAIDRMYRGRPTLGGTQAGNWGARLLSWRAHEAIYNASEDKDLFTDPNSGRLYTAKDVLGIDPGHEGDAIELMREKGFWPVFEGKHVDQFLVGIKPVRWWLSVEQARRKYDKEPRSSPTLVFRETASNTNERTCIAAVLPEFAGAAHTLTGITLSNVDPARACVILNSMCFDFALRLRTAGIHVSFTYMLPMPVPSADDVNRLPVLETRLAWDSGIEHISEDESTWPALWTANRAVAEAYGLGAADFAHVLDSFPVLERKRRNFMDFFRKCLSDWEKEELTNRSE